MEFEGQEINFEKAFKELEKITNRLESDKDGLEESLKLYKKGLNLCKICEESLKNAKLEIEYDGEENLEE